MFAYFINLSRWPVSLYTVSCLNSDIIMLFIVVLAQWSDTGFIKG